MYAVRHLRIPTVSDTEHAANMPAPDRTPKFARRNIAINEEVPKAEKEQRYPAVAHRYRVYWEALELSDFSRLRK
jgi:hypothetical protein